MSIEKLREMSAAGRSVIRVADQRTAIAEYDEARAQVEAMQWAHRQLRAEMDALRESRCDLVSRGVAQLVDHPGVPWETAHASLSGALTAFEAAREYVHCLEHALHKSTPSGEEDRLRERVAELEAELRALKPDGLT